MAKRKGSGGRSGNVRIIAGRFRGRRLELADPQAIRPTPDRIRETLFNWLAPVLPGSRCLDLFAGTGVLGIESLSRGAARVVFVEKAPAVARHLETCLDSLDADGCEVMNVDAMRYLAATPLKFDVAFLDPPYGTDLAKLCKLLDGGWLAPGAQVYLECNRKQALPELPESWQLSREKTAGQVRFALAQRG